MTKIKLNDLCFLGDDSSSKYHKSEFIQWDRSSGGGPVVFFTDDCLGMADMPIYKNNYKIAWLIEPFAIRQDTYQYVMQNWQKFSLVLSHQVALSNHIKNFEYFPSLMNWVSKEHFGRTTKSVFNTPSIVASDKNYTEGHRLRHRIISRFGKNLMVYGKGYVPIPHKFKVLQPFAFHLAIENSNAYNYFTEKVLDPISTWTVPIYWGTDGIFEFFNKDGFFTFNTEDELGEILLYISKEGESIYNKMLPAVEENYNILLDLGVVAEDWIYKNILKPKGLV